MMIESSNSGRRPGTRDARTATRNRIHQSGHKNSGLPGNHGGNRDRRNRVRRDSCRPSHQRVELESRNHRSARDRGHNNGRDDLDYFVMESYFRIHKQCPSSTREKRQDHDATHIPTPCET